MSISSLIRKEKERFLNKRVQIQKNKAIAEGNRLHNERIRQGELAQANAERVRLQKDVERLKAFNEKANPQKPNRLATFGRNLAKHLNENKQRSSMPSKNIAKNTGRNLNRVNSGSTGIQFGVTNPGVFELGGGDKGKKKNPFM